uniref:Uncharacterized protein n=1 Tax=Spermophilus dauricus TaxID=99837 RepID=A0A8C9QCW3_SPEDA
MRHSHSRHCSGLSSEPSSQSGSPSHCHRLGTHWPLLHTKSDSAHVFFTFFSSLPSTQSSSPSHFHSRVIQRPLVHWNWEGSHLAFLPRIRKKHLAKTQTKHTTMDIFLKRVAPPPEEPQAGPSEGIPEEGSEEVTASCMLLPLKIFLWDKVWR